MGSLQEYHDKMGPPIDGKPTSELMIPNCGESTRVYHDDLGFLVFCVLRQKHGGAHHASVAWGEGHPNDAT